MTTAQIEAGCYLVACLSALAVIALRNPHSLLSRLVDRIDDTTTRKALR